MVIAMTGRVNVAERHCYVCGRATRGLLDLPVCELVQCGQCGHVQAAAGANHSEEATMVYSHAGYAGFRDDPVFRATLEKEVRSRLANIVPPPARILDVGCGNGAFLRVAKAEGYEVLGIDTSVAAVELCQRQGFAAQAISIDSESLQREWDIVSFWDVLEHIPDPMPVLARARSLLRSGGCIVIKVPSPRARAYRLLRLVPSLARVALLVPGHVTFFSPLSLRIALKNSGFALIDLEERGSMRGKKAVKTGRQAIGRLIREGLERYGAVRNLYAIAAVSEDESREGDGRG